MSILDFFRSKKDVSKEKYNDVIASTAATYGDTDSETEDVSADSGDAGSDGGGSDGGGGGE